MPHQVVRRRVGDDVGDRVVLDLAVRVVAAEDPTPTAPSTSLSSIFPIDISVIVIARSSVLLTWLSRTSTRAKWVTMPSRPPVTVHPSTTLGARSKPKEMSIPWTNAEGVSGRRSRGSRSDRGARGSVQLGALDDDPLELDAVGAVDLDPVRASAHGQVADGDVVGGDHDAASDDRTIFADQGLGMVEHERARWTPPGRRTVGGSTAHAVPRIASAAGAAAESARPGRRLAAVLGPREARRAAGP